MTVSYSMGRTCSGCGKTISNASTSGKCKVCYIRSHNADPVIRRRVTDAQRAMLLARPEVLQRKRDCINQARDAYYSDPANKAARRANGLRSAPVLITPEVMAKSAAARWQKAFGWCPPEYLAAYRHLCRAHGIRVAEAKAIILNQIKTDRARMSPFERQDAALAAQMRRAA